MARQEKRGRPHTTLAWATKGAVLEDIDTSTIPYVHSNWIEDGPRPAREIAQHAAIEFTERFEAGSDCFKLTKKQAAVLRAIIGRGGMPESMLLSCMPTRLHLTSALGGHWKKHWHKHRLEPSRQYMFLTGITDSGNTLARRPNVCPEALRRLFDKLIRQAGLHGNFVLEVQVITNFPRGGHGGTHCWHFHAILTTDDPDLDLGKLQAKLRQSKRLFNIFDAPTVTVKPIDGLAHLLRCCTYMLKAPAFGKFLAPHRDIPRGWTFKKVFVRKDEALRLGEAISQLELGQVIHSVRDGKHLLRPAMKAVRARHKAQYAKTRNKLPENFDLATFWAELRQGRKKNLYEPYAFSQSRTGCGSNEWVRVASKALKDINARREKAGEGSAKCGSINPRNSDGRRRGRVRAGLARM